MTSKYIAAILSLIAFGLFVFVIFLLNNYEKPTLLSDPITLVGFKNEPIEVGLKDPFGYYVKSESPENLYLGFGYLFASEHAVGLQLEKMRIYGDWSQITGQNQFDQDIWFKGLFLAKHAKSIVKQFKPETLKYYVGLVEGINLFYRTVPAQKYDTFSELNRVKSFEWSVHDLVALQLFQSLSLKISGFIQKELLASILELESQGFYSQESENLGYAWIKDELPFIEMLSLLSRYYHLPSGLDLTGDLKLFIDPLENYMLTFKFNQSDFRNFKMKPVTWLIGKNNHYLTGHYLAYAHISLIDSISPSELVLNPQLKGPLTFNLVEKSLVNKEKMPLLDNNERVKVIELPVSEQNIVIEIPEKDKYLAINLDKISCQTDTLIIGNPEKIVDGHTGKWPFAIININNSTDVYSLFDPKFQAFNFNDGVYRDMQSGNFNPQLLKEWITTYIVRQNQVLLSLVNQTLAESEFSTLVNRTGLSEWKGDFHSQSQNGIFIERWMNMVIENLDFQELNLVKKEVLSSPVLKTAIMARLLNNYHTNQNYNHLSHQELSQILLASLESVVTSDLEPLKLSGNLLTQIKPNAKMANSENYFPCNTWDIELVGWIIESKSEISTLFLVDQQIKINSQNSPEILNSAIPMLEMRQWKSQ